MCKSINYQSFHFYIKESLFLFQAKPNLSFFSPLFLVTKEKSGYIKG